MCSMTPTWPVFKKGTQFARAIWNDTSGVILPYVTVMLVVIVGLSVLALDGARLMSLQTQLQNGADALALAGAAELDRLPDAETRARTAIERLLTNSTLYRVPEIVTRGRFPDGGESDSTWRTQEA